MLRWPNAQMAEPLETPCPMPIIYPQALDSLPVESRYVLKHAQGRALDAFDTAAAAAAPLSPQPLLRITYVA